MVYTHGNHVWRRNVHYIVHQRGPRYMVRFGKYHESRWHLQKYCALDANAHLWYTYSG